MKSMSCNLRDCVWRLIGRTPAPFRVMLKSARNLFVRVQTLIVPIFGRKVVSAFWADALNFGDLITPALLKSYGTVPRLNRGGGGGLCSCGSILGWLDDDFSGVVIGSGLAMEKEAKAMPSAKFLCVRGRLTRQAMKLGEDVLLGDPGLLAERLIPKAKVVKKYKVGIVLHQINQKSSLALGLVSRLGKQHGKIKIISTRGLPKAVIREIVSCEYILSSSLHGLIIADAFAIPNARVKFEKSLDDFKFNDYYSAYNEASSLYDVQSLKTVVDVEGICKFPKERRECITQLKAGLSACYERYLREVV